MLAVLTAVSALINVPTTTIPKFPRELNRLLVAFSPERQGMPTNADDLRHFVAWI
ncbi:hypothetical protein [Gordonia hydrophobica]|uniref:Uncharacterized protein n=1 Tax=Gordonia hydrophobica TaxID=40516 RepID=A0ABZ2U506_9ACTN|nr:hypothetical protein [Gordonia hydrophobica]MBM7368636.1 hypothetical protein [Gordonia hydrophobica]